MKKTVFSSLAITPRWNQFIKLLVMLKIISGFICLFIAQSFAGETYGQEKVSIDLRNASLKQIILEIERQTSIKFVYSDDIIPTNEKSKVKVQNTSWIDVITPLLADDGLSIKLHGDDMAVISKTSKTQVQQTVSGRVLSSSGEAVEGVSVVEKGTQTGTSTTADGSFSLPVSRRPTILVFSAMGYVTREVTASEESMTVTLEEDAFALEETVVVGFATQRRANLTGAVQSVRMDELEDMPATNVSTALQGRLAGVTITQNSGQPGNDQGQIRIRGVGTIGNASPMVIVDGIESSMNNVNPQDIESVTVLKDAASASIYGSKAANGVMLITTKKGANTEPMLSYTGYFGVQNPTSLPDYLRSYDHAILLNEALTNEGRPLRFDQTQLDGFRQGLNTDEYPDTDWLGKFYAGSGAQQTHNLQLSGGSSNVKYFMSMGYLGQEGIIDIARNDRYNFRTNIDADVSDRLNLSLGLAYNYEKIAEPTNPYTDDMAQIFRQINRIPSFIRHQYDNGVYGYYDDGNPLAWMDLGAADDIRRRHMMINASGTYKILEGLNFKQVVSFQPRDISSERFVKDIQFQNHQTGANTLYQGPNQLTDNRYVEERLTFQSLLTYEKSIQSHNFNVLAGYMQESYREDWTQGFRLNFLNNDVHELNAGSADGQEATGGAVSLNLRSYFGRINYDYAGKYLVEANIRHDGSSRFGPGNRWGTFPSFSLGWRLTQEDFISSSRFTDVISDLKLRGGWGMLGNQDTQLGGIVSYYPSIFTITPNQNYPIGGSLNTGVSIVNAANPDIRWETTESWNIGLDFSLANLSLNGSLDYFVRDTRDILLQLPVPVTFGLPAPYQNAGSVRNNGVELQLNYQGSSNDFTYQIGVNGAYVKNRITDWGGLDPQPHNDFYRYNVGDPVRSFFGYEALGIYRSAEEYQNAGVTGVNINVGAGDIIYRDVDGDNRITPNDRVYLGSPDPRYTFGLNLSSAYKGFDLTLFFQGAADVEGYLWGEAVGGISGAEKPTAAFMDRFHPDLNPNGNMPRALTTWNQNSSLTYPSSFWVVDGSYVRLKNLTFGYTFPSQILNTVGVRNIRIYYSGQNLLTFSNFWEGFDPEAPAGTRGNFYPQVKVNTIGLNVNF